LIQSTASVQKGIGKNLGEWVMGPPSEGEENKGEDHTS